MARRGAVAGALALGLTLCLTLGVAPPLSSVSGMVPARADARAPVRAEPLDFVDVRSGRPVSRVGVDSPFWVRYSLANQHPYPVRVDEVRSEVLIPAECGIEVRPDQSRGTTLPLVLPGGTAAHVGEDTRTWVRTGECRARIDWRATVVAERVPSRLALSAPDHRFGESPRLEATLHSDASPQPGRIRFLSGGVTLGEAPVRDGNARLALPARRLPPGQHTLTATYLPAPDGPAGSTADPVEVEVARTGRASTTTVRASSQAHDRPGRLSARVSPVGASGEVVFVLDGQPFGSPVTVDRGRAVLRTAPGELDVGRHELTATFTPDDPDVAGSAARGAPFEVDQVPAAVRAEVTPAEVPPGGPVTVRGRVQLGSGDRPVPTDARIDVLDAGGRRLASTTAADDGRFETVALLPRVVDEGAVRLFVSFPGSVTIAGAMVERRVQVVRPDPSPGPSASPSPAPTPGSPASGSSGGPTGTTGPGPTADPVGVPTGAGPQAPSYGVHPAGAPSGAPLLVGLGLVLCGAVLVLRQVWRS